MLLNKFIMNNYLLIIGVGLIMIIYLIVSWIHQKNVRQKRLDNYEKIINCYNEQRTKWIELLRDTMKFEYNVYEIESNEYREIIRELVKIHEIMCDQSPKIMSYKQIYRLIPRNDLRDHKAINWFNAIPGNRSIEFIRVLNEIYYDVTESLNEYRHNLDILNLFES